MSRQRRSPVQKARREARTQAERAQPVTSDHKLERCVQVLKLIEIKRRIIAECNWKLPFAAGGTVLVAIPFAIAILLVSPLGILIMGALWSGVLSQLVGPFGAYTKRKKARADVDALRTELIGLLSELGNARVFVFAVTGASEVGVTAKGPPAPVDRQMAMSIDRDGQFAFAPYKHLGIAFLREGAAAPAFEDRQIKHLDWVTFARSKKASEESLTAFVARPTI